MAPGNSEQIVDLAGGGVNVTFSWQDSEGNPAASYHLQVSKSPYFASDSTLVDRDGLLSRDFRLAGLSPGTYYWRLKAKAKSSQTTNWNDPWKFMVVRAGDSVAIDASEWQVQRVGGNISIISGKTQPGMEVRSQGRSTYAGPDGSFRLQVNSASIETTVEISDDRGNRTGFILSLRSGTVIRRY